MEDIFTDSQVHGHSMIDKNGIRLFILCWLFAFASFSQTLSSSDKKAIKLYHKGEEAVIDRDFEKATMLFKDAIKRDPQFGEPYLRLVNIYNIYQKKDSALHYLSQYSEVTPEEKVHWKTWRNLAYLNFEFGKYEGANRALQHLLRQKPEHITEPGLGLLSESIEYAIEAVANPMEIHVRELPNEVNRYALQYFPVLTVDDRMLIYTARKSTDMNADEDLVYSVRLDSGWSRSKSISPHINTELNEGACTVSADGRTLIFTSCDEERTFGSCDLFISRKNGDSWSKPENLGLMVNSTFWDSQPSLSGDGRTLYFSSNRPGGYGKRDIWVTQFDGSVWTSPLNIGAPINGFRDETTPFIHSNNNILLFSSNSHPGLGGYDLFFVKKENNIWGKVRNLGFPINSYQDEVSIYISSNGTDAYYSKEVEREGRTVSSKIVHFQIQSDSFKISKSSYVTGVVTDAETHQPLKAQLKLMNLNDSSDVYLVYSDTETGSYFLTITENNEYGVFVNEQGYLFENLSFTSRENTILRPDTVDIALKPIREGQKTVLENIYFEFDDHQLHAKSRHELLSIAEFIKTNPGIRFSIEGHTDKRGSESYNQALSLKRANAVYNYLISLGIPASRLEARGLGSMHPIAQGDSESAHQLNRRIEFIVLK